MRGFYDIKKIPVEGMLSTGKFAPFTPPVSTIQIEKEIKDHEESDTGITG